MASADTRRKSFLQTRERAFNANLLAFLVSQSAKKPIEEKMTSRSLRAYDTTRISCVPRIFLAHT